MPSAVYCHEEEPGTEPHVPAELAVTGGQVLVSSGYGISRVASLSALAEVVPDGLGDIFLSAGPAGKVCWFGGAPDGGGVDCADPSGSGPPVRWLSVDANGTPNHIAKVPGTTDFVVSYLPGPNEVQARLVLADATGPKGASFARLPGLAAGLAVVGRDAFAIVKGEILRAPLDGTAEPSSVARVGESCSLYVADGTLYCGGSTTVTRIAPGTPSAPQPLASPGFVVPKADSLLVRESTDQIEEVAFDGTVRRVLWQRPAGFDDESIRASAADDTSLVVVLVHHACTWVGHDKSSQKVCDDSRGRLEIVRVPR